MFVATSTTINNNNNNNNNSNNHLPSYIVAAATTNPTIDNTTTSTTTTANNTAPQALSDIKLICIQRKKRSKRHIYLTFVESRPLSPNEQPCIEIVRKSNTSSSSSSSSSSQQSIYLLNECISFEYFDTVKNDFQTFIYVYFESYTISIFYSDENFDKKSLIVKHLEYMYQSKTEKANEINNNSSQDPTQSQLIITPGQQTQQNQTQQTSSILPCTTTTEQILHTFDVNLIPYGPIISRDHVLIGPARLYFTTTDLYIASINSNRLDLRITITNQCPYKDKTILCIPYFTIKNYGNRSNIFLIELGKSNYGNGEIHMKCYSSSLASTIHLLVSPVIEERPLILSSAFQNQLLTNKRIEKSKNIQPPIQLNNNDTINNTLILDSTLPFIKKQSLEINQQDTTKPISTTSNDIKSRLVVGFFRTLTKNVSNLRRSATFHSNSNNNNNNNNNNVNNNSNNLNEKLLTIDNNLLTKNKYVAFNLDEKKFPNNDHNQIILPESQKKTDSISSTSSNLTKQTNETMLTSTSSTNLNKQETTTTTTTTTTMGTYIDMGPTIQKTNENLKENIEDEIINEQTTATAEIGVNTTISLSPYVRSAIIVGNSVHLIADEKTLFPIGQRSFTSPASVMQPFKTQLNGHNTMNPYGTSTDLITSSPNSSNSLHQINSVSNSQQSLLLSYGIVTFNNNDYMLSDQTERPISPPSDGSTLDQRLNSDISLMSQQQQQQQGSTIYPLDNILSSSNTHILRTLSVSANNIVDSTSSQIRTPHGSIIVFDDHLNDQATATTTTTTYLLGAPSIVNDETLSTNSSRLSSFNLTTSISRPYLSHIDEEKTSPNDPYALIEPISTNNSPQSISTINLLPQISDKNLNYADLLLPNENLDSNEQQQQQQQNIDNDDNNDDNNDYKEQECELNELSSTKLYTDIDFHQTQRRERIIQSAAKAKMEDQTPPFVL